MRPYVGAECAPHIHVNVLPGCFQISRASPKRPQTLKRGFVLETHWRHLFGSGVRQKGQFWRAWNAGLFTWNSQTCFVSLLGFVSFSTYFPIRNQWQLVTLWKGPRTLSIGCVWMASWVDSPQLYIDGAGAALLRGARCGQASITWWTQCYHDLRRPGSAVRMFMRPFVWAECAQHIHVNVLPGCFQISRANPEATASEERVRPRNTLAPFVRVRCAAKRTILAHRERRAVHMQPCTWPSQTCFARLLGFVSFSTYFPIRNQLQLVTLWNGPHTLSIGCVWMASWVDSPQVCGDGAGAALLRGARCGQVGHLVETSLRHSVTTICVDRGQLFGCSCALLFGPSVLRGSVLETHWHRLFGSGVRQKGQLWRTWSAGLFTWSRARGGCRMS